MPKQWIENSILITVSQTHRIVEVEGDLWRPLGPTLLLIEGHLKQLSQDHVQMALNASKEGNPATSGNHIRALLSRHITKLIKKKKKKVKY